MTREREFNISGPMKPEIHYCLDPLKRVDQEDIFELIDGMKYFALHAPRQSGKTTLLLTLAARLNVEGRYRALYVNVEAAQAARDNVDDGMQTILAELVSSARKQLDDDWPSDYWESLLQKVGSKAALAALLEQWSERVPQ
jgi:hypothetical protein